MTAVRAAEVLFELPLDGRLVVLGEPLGVVGDLEPGESFLVVDGPPRRPALTA
jgi:hypothetical protein